MPSGHVLEGSDGWLFLGEGSNYSISQMTGKMSPTVKVQKKWTNALNMRSKVLGDRLLTVVCPEKACIYSDNLPAGLKIFPGRFSQVLAGRHDRFLYALNFIRPDTCEHLLYSRADTHFTDYGAFIAAGEMLTSLGLKPPPPPEGWDVVKAIGDLGAALDPQKMGENVLGRKLPHLEVIDNGLRNRGRVTIYRNLGATGARMLIFGDSFSGLNLARWVSYAASEVTFIHSSSFDYGAIDRIGPDFVIGEYAERFLIESPEEGRSLFSVILEKRLQNLYTSKMLEQFQSSFDLFKHLYGPEMASNLKAIIG
jgi:alginate O-acetyltransferase complex protein AlgJ